MSTPVQVATSNEATDNQPGKGDGGPHSPPSVADPEKSSAFQSTSNTGDEETVPDSRPETVLEKWNESPLNIYRFFTTLYSFIIMGMNDAALGVSTGNAPRRRHLQELMEPRRYSHMYGIQ